MRGSGLTRAQEPLLCHGFPGGTREKITRPSIFFSLRPNRLAINKLFLQSASWESISPCNRIFSSLQDFFRDRRGGRIKNRQKNCNQLNQIYLFRIYRPIPFFIVCFFRTVIDCIYSSRTSRSEKILVLHAAFSFAVGRLEARVFFCFVIDRKNITIGEGTHMSS